MFEFTRGRLISVMLLFGMAAAGILTAHEVKVNGTIQIKIKPQVPGKDHFSFTPPTGYEFIPDSGETTLHSASLTAEEAIDAAGEYAVDIAIDADFTGQYNAVCSGALRPISGGGGNGPVPELWWKAEISDDGGLNVQPAVTVITWTEATRQGARKAAFTANGAEAENVSWTGPTDGWTWTPENRQGGAVTLEPADADRSKVGAYEVTATDNESDASADATLYVIDVDLIIADSREAGDADNPDHEEDPGVDLRQDEFYPITIKINDAGVSDLEGDAAVELLIGQGQSLYVPDGNGYAPYDGGLCWPVGQLPDNLHVKGSTDGPDRVELKFTAPNGAAFSDTVKLNVEGIQLAINPSAICPGDSAIARATPIPADRELKWEFKDLTRTRAQFEQLTNTSARINARRRPGTVKVIVTDKSDPTVKAEAELDIVKLRIAELDPQEVEPGKTAEAVAKVIPADRELVWEFDGDSLGCQFETDEGTASTANGTSVKIKAGDRAGQVWIKVSDSENPCASDRRRMYISSPCESLPTGTSFDLGVSVVTLQAAAKPVGGPDAQGYCTYETNEASFEFGVPHPASGLQLPVRTLYFNGVEGFKLTFKYKHPEEDEEDSVGDSKAFGIAFHPESPDDYLSISDKFGPISIKIAKLALTIDRPTGAAMYQLNGAATFSVFLRRDYKFGKNLILRRKLMPQEGDEEELLRGDVTVSLKNMFNLQDFDADRISWDFSGIQNVQIDVMKKRYNRDRNPESRGRRVRIIMIRGSFTKEGIFCVNATVATNSEPWKTNMFQATLCSGSQISFLYDLATGKFTFYSGTLIIEVSEIKNVTGAIKFTGSFNDGAQLNCGETPLPSINDSDQTWTFKAELDPESKLKVFGFKIMPADDSSVASLEVELTSDFELNRIEAKNILATRNDMRKKDGSTAVRIQVDEMLISDGGLQTFVLGRSELKYKRFEMMFVEAVYRSNDAQNTAQVSETAAPKMLGFQLVRADLNGRPLPPRRRKPTEPEAQDVPDTKGCGENEQDEDAPQDVTCEVCECQYPTDMEDGDDPDGALLKITGYIGFQFSADGEVKVAFRDYVINTSGDVSVGEIAAKFASPPFDVCFKAEFGDSSFQGCFLGNLSGGVKVAGTMLIGTEPTFVYGKLTLDVSLGSAGIPLIIPPPAGPGETGLVLDRLMGAFGWNVKTISPENATLANPGEVKPFKGSFYAGLGLGIRDRANLCRFTTFAAIELGSDHPFVQLLLELQVTARKKILVAGANVTYELWDNKIAGNVNAALTIPEDGSMLSLDGKAAYTISADSWSVSKPEKQEHAMTGTLLNGIATLTGDIDMQGSNRRPALFPKGTIKGWMESDATFLLLIPQDLAHLYREKIDVKIVTGLVLKT